jgi:hypothetical protein
MIHVWRIKNSHFVIRPTMMGAPLQEVTRTWDQLPDGLKIALSLLMAAGVGIHIAGLGVQSECGYFEIDNSALGRSSKMLGDGK